ncbi:MAG: hypothetical protein A4E73_00602 [Syntrophaceae bacterium PtaU1.Bin231]|nr:MAG: hypothetical protein A4E73_00602 [Syntrophaceae bacterium PtaU1.Bin231]
MRLGPPPSGHVRACSVHHQYSARVSPFHAKTAAVPASAIAAAAWSWVEKMLHEAHRRSAPRTFSVSMSMAVWIVMCRLPVTRMPLRGFLGPYFARTAMRPGISFSASFISLRPHSAWDMSLTLKGRLGSNC